MGVDPEARIHMRRDILKEVDGPMLRHGLQEMHGSSLVLQRDVSSRPNRELLEERFAQFPVA
jgi:putative restriction endonuclease